MRRLNKNKGGRGVVVAGERKTTADSFNPRSSAGHGGEEKPLKDPHIWLCVEMRRPGGRPSSHA